MHPGWGNSTTPAPRLPSTFLRSRCDPAGVVFLECAIPAVSLRSTAG